MGRRIQSPRGNLAIKMLEKIIRKEGAVFTSHLDLVLSDIDL